jgi:hypothetical protein
MEIKLYKSPWRAIKLLFLSSVFVVGGILLLTQPAAPRWLGWFTISFFGLGYPVAIFHLLDRRPQIIINELGIFDRTTYKDFINWEVIRDAYPIDISGQKYVCLVVDEKYEPSYTKRGLARSAARLAKKIGAQELNIWLGQINIDEKKLTQFILSMIGTSPSNRSKNLRILLTNPIPTF